MKQQKTIVVFRKWPDSGTIIALFPLEPGTADPYTCDSFEHVGQHGTADPRIVYHTHAATTVEYAALKAELESEPYCYSLTVQTRIPRNALAMRRRAIEAQSLTK